MTLVKTTIVHLLFYYIIILSIQSCTSEKQWDTINIEQSIKTLEIDENILTLYDVLPIGLGYHDSILFINLAKSPHALIALNLNTKTIIDSFGYIGQGPGELLNPEFAIQISPNPPILYDLHTKKMMDIAYNQNKYQLNTQLNFPEEIFPASDIALSSSYITGRNLRSPESMFFIYNTHIHQIIDIPFYPVIKELTNRRDYYFAVRTAIHQNEKKIIAASYFMNLVHMYSLEGEHLKSFAFSDEPLPKIDSKTKEIKINSQYTGIQAILPTDHYFYVLIKTKNAQVKQEAVLAQLSWEGNLIQAFKIKEDIIGGVCIDNNKNTIYAITQHLDQDGGEIQKIVSYKLQ